MLLLYNYRHGYMYPLVSATA